MNRPPAMYPSTDQLPILSSVRILVRTTGDPGTVVGAVRNIFAELDPDLALFGIETLDQTLAATIGRGPLHGVARVYLRHRRPPPRDDGCLRNPRILRDTADRRDRNTGGPRASRESVAGMVVRQGMVLVGLGILLGLAGALATSRLLSSQLYGVSAIDANTFILVALGTVAVSLIAAFLPAARAALIDPTVALQAE